MAKEGDSKKTWIKKLLHRYRMIVVNETTFEEQFYFRLSRLNLIIVLILLVSSIMIGTFALILYTPVKEFIPGYPSSQMRLDAMQNTFRLDSILTVTRQQQKFLESIKKVLLGGNPIPETEKNNVPIKTTKKEIYFVPGSSEFKDINRRTAWLFLPQFILFLAALTSALIGGGD